MEPEDVVAAVEEIRAISDDEARVLAAHRLIQVMVRAIVELSDIRSLGLRRLRRAAPKSWRYVDVAEKLELDVEKPIQAAQSIVRGRRSKRGADS